MSIWQNFKDTDHGFEKKLTSVLICMALCIALFFLIDKGFDNIPDVKKLFVENGKIFRWFLFGSSGVFFICYSTYVSTLDFWEAETKASLKASVISVILWTAIWISWSIFCAWLTFNFTPLTPLVKFTIIALVLIPGLIAFFFSRNFRQQQLKQEEEYKKSTAINQSISEPYTICIDRKYYSGYYGLLCLPVYLIALLLGQFF